MKTALLIDGGYLRANARRSGLNYDNNLIERFARSCFQDDEYVFRIFYYDSPQFRGQVPKPVSGDMRNFNASDQWLVDLAKLDRFAVRRGTLGFRGWNLKDFRDRPMPDPLTDNDFSPAFEQKGVDMRIGLDIAVFSERRSVDRIVLVCGDTDMVPAMKQARKSGLEVALTQLPEPIYRLHDTLLSHADTVRDVAWP